MSAGLEHLDESAVARHCVGRLEATLRVPRLPLCSRHHLDARGRLHRCRRVRLLVEGVQQEQRLVLELRQGLGLSGSLLEPSEERDLLRREVVCGLPWARGVGGRVGMWEAYRRFPIIARGRGGLSPPPREVRSRWVVGCRRRVM